MDGHEDATNKMSVEIYTGEGLKARLKYHIVPFPSVYTHTIYRRS